MKKVLLLLVAILGLCSAKAQDVSVPSPIVVKVVDSTNGAKNELYTRARAWVATSFNSAQAVIQMDDREAGKIIGKAIMLYPVRSLLGDRVCDASIHYTFTIDVKDGKYRMTLSDYYHTGCSTANGRTPDFGSIDPEKQSGDWTQRTSRKDWTNIRQTAYAYGEKLIDSFNAAMKKAANNTSSNDGY